MAGEKYTGDGWGGRDLPLCWVTAQGAKDLASKRPTCQPGSFQAVCHTRRSSGISKHPLGVTLRWGQVYSLQSYLLRLSAETEGGSLHLKSEP